MSGHCCVCVWGRADVCLYISGSRMFAQHICVCVVHVFTCVFILDLDLCMWAQVCVVHEYVYLNICIVSACPELKVWSTCALGTFACDCVCRGVHIWFTCVCLYSFVLSFDTNCFSPTVLEALPRGGGWTWGAEGPSVSPRGGLV